jgi:hypothetical protein
LAVGVEVMSVEVVASDDAVEDTERRSGANLSWHIRGVAGTVTGRGRAGPAAMDCLGCLEVPRDQVRARVRKLLVLFEWRREEGCGGGERGERGEPDRSSALAE